MKSHSLLTHIRNYLGATFASKFVIFLSIIIYSRLMSVEDYGVLNLYAAYIWIFVILFSGNLYTAVGRYIFEHKSDFPSFFTTSMLLMSFLFVSLSLIIFMNLDFFSKILRLPDIAITLLVITVLATIMESIFTQISIFEEKSGLLFKVISSKAFGTFLLSILALLFIIKSDKYLAVMYSEALGSIILIVYVFLKVKHKFHFKFIKEHVKYMLTYSIPLIPYMVSLTLLSQSDRIMIDYFYSSYETGLYSLAYNIGIILTLIMSALLNAWNPSYFKYMNNKEYQKVESGSDTIFFIAITITLFIILFGEAISKIIISNTYYESLSIIPVIALGGLASALWQIWGRVIGYIHKTYITSLLAVFAVIINIGLNYLLLPVYGYEIAAWTTVVAYLFIGIISLIVSNRFINLYKVSLIDKIAKIILLLFIYIFFKFLTNNIFIELSGKLLIMSTFLYYYRNVLLNIKRDLL